MFKSGSTKLVKNLNQQHVLNLVRINPKISAPEITSKTGLQMTTVAYTLKELKKAGYIQKAGYGNSKYQGGKPPILWDLCSSYGFVIGLELMPSEIRLVILDFSTKVIFTEIFAVNLQSDTEKIGHEVKRIVDQALSENNISHDTVLGMGIGIPGFIDAREGFIHYSYTFDLRGVSIREAIQLHFNFPVEIANDADAGALGIKWLSRTEHLVPNILYVIVNQNFQGIGVGIIIRHELYEGTKGCTGEVKDFMPASKRRRIVKLAEEKYGAGSAVIKMLKELEPGKIPVSILVDAADEGDGAAVYILNEAAKIISKELARIINLLSPDILIIGGDICTAEKYIINIIQERVGKMVLAEFLQPIPIQFSPFGIYSAAMGSTALILRRIFSPD